MHPERIGEQKGIVVSGTYSTGKTTTTMTLSLATGIPMINALSAREILVSLYPEREFQHMSSTELLALGLKRMEERIREEAIIRASGNSFISDGSVLNEWIYGTVRMKVGINPGAPFLQRFVKAIMGFAAKPFFRRYLSAYGQVTSIHAKAWYTHVVHLPIEFPMDPDGHRPVSEKYRTLSDVEMQKTFETLGMPVYVVTGSVAQRVEKIMGLLDLPQIKPIEEAEAEAREVLSSNSEALAKKMIEQHHDLSIAEKIKIITRL
jgi:hypothetical protein